MYEVVAYDPGGHTGVAWFRDGNFVVARTFTDQDGLIQLYMDLGRTIESLDPHAVVVVEGVPARPNPGAASLNAIQIVGFLIGYASYRRHRVVIHQPSRRTPHEDAARLYRSANEHERSAIAHALAFFHNETRSH